MVTRRTILRSGLVVGAGVVGLAASSPASAQSAGLVVDDFSSWPGDNALGEWAGAGSFENGVGGTPGAIGGSGEVVDGALRLEYDGAGWLLSNVRQSVVGYSSLELVVRGDSGGEESDVHLEVGGVRDSLTNLTSDTIGTTFSTVSVDLQSAGVDPSAVDDVWLTFWQGGNNAIEIEEIRFAGSCAGIPVGEYCATDPSGDGKYTDVNGNGGNDFDDVVTFFEEMQSDGVQNNVDAFDFNDNGSIDFDDIVALFDRV